MGEVTGTADNDILVENPSDGVSDNTNNTFQGLDGDDTIVAGPEDPAYYVNNGGQTKVVQDNDVLIGGAGDDTMTGGYGNDTFVFTFDVHQSTALHADNYTTWAAAHGVVVQDCITQSAFSTSYSAWVQYVIDTLHIGADTDLDGTVEFTINQNDASGLPTIEGLSQAQVDAIFGGTDDLIVKAGSTKQTRYYSNTAEVAGGLSVDGEGHDTVLDFGNGNDSLQLNGLAGISQADFVALFDVASDATETVLSWAGGSITIVGLANVGDDADFYGMAMANNWFHA